MSGVAVYPKYEVYKNSKCNWKGFTPAHWLIIKFKFTATIRKGKIPKKIVTENTGNLPAYLSMDYLRGGNTNQYVFDKDATVIDEKEILLLWDGSNAGEFIHSRKGVISSTVAEVKYHKLNKEFAWYASSLLERLLRNSTIGMGIPHVNGEELKNFKLPLPPLEEQVSIANFLDQKTAQIDAAIAIKEQQIALLKERKQIMIQQAVTQGLNPDVPMKDSGVAWIGRIPEHWQLIKLKHACTVIQTGPFGTELHSYDYISNGIPLINPKHMADGKVLPEDTCSVDSLKAYRLRRYKLFIGDLILARRGELGRCAVISEIENGWICGTGSIMLRPKSLYYSTDYLQKIISGKRVAETLSLSSVGSTMDNLNTSILGNLLLPMPPIYEQEKVISELKIASEKIDKLLDLYLIEIQKLKEYKTTLINSAVTGKIKITPDMIATERT